MPGQPCGCPGINPSLSPPLSPKPGNFPVYQCMSNCRFVYFLSRVESFMQRTYLRKLVTTCVGLAIIVASILSVVFIARAKQNSPFVLTNQSVPLVSRAHMVG